MNRRTRWSLALLGAALLIGAPTVWFVTRPADQVGDLGAAGLEVEAPSGTGGQTEPDAQPEGPPDEVVGDVGDVGEVGADGAAVPLAASELSGPLSHHPAPTSLAIPDIDAEAPVVPVGLEPDGTMEIPDDVNIVGWYEPGVRPGESGTAVLTGHVDSREQGPGVLFDLRDLDLGATIVTEGDRGEPQRWSVVARTRYEKTQLPIDDLFVWGGPPRLVVITCGGEFDAATRSYSDNVVVVAEPAT